MKHMKKHKKLPWMMLYIVLTFLIFLVILLPIGGALLAAYRVPQHVQSILGERYADFTDEQKQTLILNVRCHITHERLATVYSMIPDVVRDQTLIGFGCDPVRIWTLTQKHHAQRYRVDN